MNFKDVEDKFKQLRSQFIAGQFSEQEFKAKLEEMMIQDDQGHWWMIGSETGLWYYNDGTKWVRSKPPTPLRPDKPNLLRRALWIGAGALVLLGIIGLVWKILTPPIQVPTPTPTAIATPAPTTTSIPTNTPIPSLTSTPVPVLAIGSTWTRPADGMVMMYVPEGNFTMGAKNGFSEQQPVHTVGVDAFWIDRTEVTNAMYAKCVLAGGCQQPKSTSSSTRNNYYGAAQYANYPVINVTWDNANGYCQWAGVHLPTEAEWEKAARGTDGRTYPWGDDVPTCSLANFWNVNRGCFGDTSPVGSYPSGASPYKALDMAGNVWEWVMDWYDPGYYAKSLSFNPSGPISGTNRVLRGGAWGYGADYVSSSYRYGHIPASTDSNFGFRCSRFSQ
jgi:formylglycine-generating enzyme required for sulfatase activity